MTSASMAAATCAGADRLALQSIHRVADAVGMRGLARQCLWWCAIAAPLLGMTIASATSPDAADLEELAVAVAHGRAALDTQTWQRPFPESGEPGSAEAAYWLANAAAARGDWDAAFTAIATGARRRDIRPELPWAHGPLRQLTDDALAGIVLPCRHRVTAHCAADRLDEAVALVQATLTFGVDLTHRPFPVEWSIGGQVVDACVEMIEDQIMPRCDPAQLRALAAVVTGLDTWATPALDARIVQLLYAQRIVDGDENTIGWCSGGWVPLWEQTAQRRAAAKKLAYLAVVNDLAATAKLPWSEREAALLRADEGLAIWERSWRRHLTRLRLLRLRLAFALGETPLEVHDPLGDGPIRQEIAGDSATFTAVGATSRAIRSPVAPSPLGTGR